MKTTLIFILTFLACFCEAVNVPFTAFNSNEFNVSVPNNSISINTALFPTNGSSLYDSNGAALYQAGLSSNYSLTLSQNGTNESLQIGQANSNLTYQVGLANTNLSNLASNALRIGVLNGSIPAGSATNVTGLLTNNTTGSAATATLASNVTLLASAPAIAQYESNLVFWYNPRAIITTNNLFGTPTWSDSSLNGITGYSLGNANPIYSANGLNGSPCWQMQANFNRATGGNPSTYYAITNAAWNSGISNFCLFTVFQDTLELSTTTVPATSGGSYLYTVGTNVQMCCNPVNNNVNGNSGCLAVQTTSAAQQYIGLQHHFTPNVLCVQYVNGLENYWLNGVLVNPSTFRGSNSITALGNVITIGNAYYGSSLFASGVRAFCGNQSDFLLFTNQMPNAGVTSISAYLMQQNNIGGGTAINLFGDSIMIGSYSTSLYSNFLALAQYYNPCTFVSNFGYSGTTSGQVLNIQTNNAGAQPYNTGKVIDIWMEMVNDINNGVSLALFETHITNALNYSHSLGHKFDICTVPSFAGETGGSFTRATGNAFIYSLTNNLTPNAPDAIIDFASDTFMGTNGAYAVNTQFYANTVHPNAAGYYQLYTAEMSPVLQAQLSSGGGSWNGSFTGNGAGITNIYQSSITAPYQAGPLYIEEDVPLLDFSVASGNNPSSSGQTPTPYFTQPYLTVFTPASTLGKYWLRIPQWVTNLVIRAQYQYSGATNLFWTNGVSVFAWLPVSGEVGAGSSSSTFTLNTNGYTYVFYTNSIISTFGTNCSKGASVFCQVETVPTNIANQVSITAVHAWYKGMYDGSNW